MGCTIKATLSQLVEGYSRSNGPTEEQRTYQAVQSILERVRVTPAQYEAAHVWMAARCRIDAAIVRKDRIRRGELHADMDAAEAAIDEAIDAFSEADSYLFRLCGNVEVEVSRAV